MFDSLEEKPLRYTQSRWWVFVVCACFCSFVVLWCLASLVISFILIDQNQLFARFNDAPYSCYNFNLPSTFLVAPFIITFGTLILSLAFTVLLCPCSGRLRSKISKLDVSPKLVDRVTALDISLFQPKTALGGYITIFVVYGLVILIGNSIGQYANSTENYQVYSKYEPPALYLQITLGFPLNDVNCSQLPSFLSAGWTPSVGNSSTCLGPSSDAMTDFGCEYFSDGITSYTTVVASWKAMYQLDSQSIGEYPVQYNIYVKDPLSWDYNWRITSLATSDTRDCSPASYTPTPEHTFARVAFPEQDVCGIGPTNIMLTATPSAICSSNLLNGYELHPDLSTFSLKQKGLDYTINNLVANITIESSQINLCIVSKASLPALLSSIFSLMGASLGIHSIVKSALNKINVRFFKKKATQMKEATPLLINESKQDI